MWSHTRDMVHAYLPAHFRDPIGLAIRLVRSGDPAARLAMVTTAMGGLLSPLDRLLEPIERRYYQTAPPPSYPLILVCGPPRSGTTVVAQVLIRHLGLDYLNNLTAMFPRSPIVANRLFGRFVGRFDVGARSYYGKSDHLSGPNDALYIWDRWLGRDRTRAPEILPTPQAREMGRFFAAYEHLAGRPLLNKNNSLNTCAHLVADALPQARFLCLTREPQFLAQALLIARRQIHGDAHIPYGIHAPDSEPGEDPIVSVCRQVLYFERIAREQFQRLGPEQFRLVSYEQFCEDPSQLVREVAGEILEFPLEDLALPGSIPALKVSREPRIDSVTFRRIEETLERLRGERDPVIAAL